MNKKIIAILAIGTLVVFLLIMFSVRWLATVRENADIELVGGQTDEHGCLGPAGYSWDEEIGACIRSWEIGSEESKKAAQIAVDYFGRSASVAVLEVLPANCAGCFFVKVEEGKEAGKERFVVRLENWQAVEAMEEELFVKESEGAEFIISGLAAGFLDVEKEELALENVQVKWNLSGSEKIYPGFGLVWGQELGSRAVFEMQQSLLDRLKELGFATDEYNAGSGSAAYDEYRGILGAVVCNLIKFDAEESSRLELRCADME